MSNLSPWVVSGALTLLGTVGGVLWGPRVVKAIPEASAAPEPQGQFSRAGRDAALVEMLRGARRTIYVRTQQFNLVPIGNELAQAQQNHVQVRLEMPASEVHEKTAAELADILVGLGCVVEMATESHAAYEGTYVLVDDRTWLYSASPLVYTAPGNPRSYSKGTR